VTERPHFNWRIRGGFSAVPVAKQSSFANLDSVGGDDECEHQPIVVYKDNDLKFRFRLKDSQSVGDQVSGLMAIVFARIFSDPLVFWFFFSLFPFIVPCVSIE
jgi:hypothetical protein